MRALLLSAIALLTFSDSAHALRGILPGADCDEIVETEATLGSKLRGSLPGDSGGDFSIFFDGRSHGRDAHISYTCESGKVAIAGQIITIRVASEDEGYTVFSDWHRDLLAEFGAPERDLDEPTAADLGKALDLPMRRTAIWVVGGRAITVILEGAPGEGWEVLVAGP